MRALLSWMLARVAGAELAQDIEGDVAERGAGTWALAAMVASTLVDRVGHMWVTVWRALPGGRRAAHELRHAMRSLSRAPWYSLAVITVIAVTGALTTTGFAIVDGVLFKPLPIPRADELYVASGPGGYALSLADALAWRRAVPEAQIAMVQGVSTIGALGGADVRPASAASVEASIFDVLGQYPIVGGWMSTDFQPNPLRVRALISYSVWVRVFGARRDVVGQRLEIAGASDRGRPLPPFEVAGVLPRDFVYPSGSATPDLLMPLALRPDELSSRNAAAGQAVIRTAQPIATLLDRLLAAYGPLSTNVDDERKSLTVAVTPLSKVLLMNQQDSLRGAFLAVSLLMFMAVLNVAGLAVLRSRQRSLEFGLRRTLGAGPVDLFRLAVLDAAPLVGAGMALAIVFTPWLISTAVALIPSYIVFLKMPQLDWRVVVFWLGIATVVLLVASLASATAAPRTSIVVASRGNQSSGTGRRFGAAVIALQVAMAFVMTVGGALLVGTLWRLWQQPIGYPLADRALIDISHRGGAPADWPILTEQLAARCRAVPGVERVAIVSADGAFLSRSRRVLSFNLPAGVRPGREGLWPVSQDFFELMELRPAAGRLFTREETDAKASVLVLSEQVARRYFPGGDAVGGVLTTNATRIPITFTVIGVVRDIQLSGLSDRSGGQIYQPGRPTGQRATLLIQGRAPIRDVMSVVQSGGAGITRAKSFVSAMGSSVQLTIFRTWLFGAFTVATLTIVGVGVFGVIAMSASRRTRELGIRVALGARRDTLVLLFVREQLWAVVVGLVVGAVSAAFASRMITTYLFGVTTASIGLWSTAAVVLIATAAISALIPALAASRVDPVDALRAE